MKKTKKIEIVCSELFKKQVKALAEMNEMNVSEYIRMLVLDNVGLTNLEVKDNEKRDCIG